MKLFAIILTLLLPSMLYAQASNRPLYVSEDGWEIRSCYNGEIVRDHYPIPGSPAYQYMGKKGMWRWYGFSVIIPEGDRVYFGKNTQFIMTYEYDGETQVVEGSDLLVINLAGAVPVFAKEYGIMLPLTNATLLSTGMPQRVGNPILFVHFPLDNEPDFIAKCDVQKTLYRKGGD